jgi:NAD-dependent SIR2 family protein deacetylase
MTNYNEALFPLAAKKRSYEDLSRFVGSRAGDIPNYTMLLGAGCSVSSNVRSAGELTSIWREEISKRVCPDLIPDVDAMRDYLSKNQASWYNPTREYSSLFEKSFDLPRQRRMFVEQEVAGKSPSLGYSYLIKLVEHGFLNTIFTTNFDDLVNEAFFQFSGTRPIVCAHDSSAGSLAVTSKRPKIIKLHGDYLFDDIKATVRETESLEENTRKKFIEFGRDFGLIVVGYGGGDRSVMDVLQYLLRSDDYFKHGVYWCVRKGEHLADDLIKLLWRDRVYFVEIDGFDELMAELHNDVVGDSLPIDTSIVNDKPQTIIRGFCENVYLKGSQCAIISRDLARLKQQMDHEQLLNVFRDFRKKARDDEQDGEIEDSLKDSEFAAVLRIKEALVLGRLSMRVSALRPNWQTQVLSG